MEPSVGSRVTHDVSKVVGVLDEHEGLDVESLVRLLGDRGWPAEHTRETVRAAFGRGCVYADCRHALHAV